ncbi:MAG TPA: DNA-processing protein DprA, partial [Chloroflexota bacterium]|nr:DNA-processing protein DprA [Chloroflexota bacterium]
MGDPGLLQQPGIAVVGQLRPKPKELRDSDSRGYYLDAERAAFSIGALLAQQGINVISGLATGMDTKAHEGALAARRYAGGAPPGEHEDPPIHGRIGGTIAMMATTLAPADIYPPENTVLAARIVAAGGLLAGEYDLPARDPARFPVRNRLQSGLADVVIVVRMDNGTKRTCEHAVQQDRPIWFLEPDPRDPARHSKHYQYLYELKELGKARSFTLDQLPGMLEELYRDRVVAESVPQQAPVPGAAKPDILAETLQRDAPPMAAAMNGESTQQRMEEPVMASVDPNRVAAPAAAEATIGNVSGSDQPGAALESQATAVAALRKAAGTLARALARQEDQGLGDVIPAGQERRFDEIQKLMGQMGLIATPAADQSGAALELSDTALWLEAHLVAFYGDGAADKIKEYPYTEITRYLTRGTTDAPASGMNNGDLETLLRRVERTDADRLLNDMEALYGDKAADVTWKNPYQPYIDGVYKWITAENVAHRLDIPRTDPMRLEEGLWEAVRSGSSNEDSGSTSMAVADAIRGAWKKLGSTRLSESDLLAAGVG